MEETASSALVKEECDDEKDLHDDKKNVPDDEKDIRDDVNNAQSLKQQMLVEQHQKDLQVFYEYIGYMA